MKNTRIAGIMSLAAGLAASAGAGIANFFTGSGPTASLIKPVKTGSGSRAARSARIQAAQDKRDRKAAKRRAILNKQGILA